MTRIKVCAGRTRVACWLASGSLFLLAVTGCPFFPPPMNGDTIDAEVVGVWFNENTLEGFEFKADGTVTPLDVGPTGLLRVTPAPSYRGVVLTILSAADGIIEFQGENRLRVLFDEPRQLAFRGTFETRDEYLVSDDGDELTILTELFGDDNGLRQDRQFRKATIGERVGGDHNLRFEVEGAGYTADAQRVQEVGPQLDIYGESTSLNTLHIFVPNTVGIHAIVPGGEARIRVVLLVGTRMIAPFEMIGGSVTVTDVSATETAGTFTGMVQNFGDATDIRTIEGEFRVPR